jgi:3-oxoacyl-[acyl-carrier-protein (ACP)] synthase III-like protein
MNISAAETTKLARKSVEGLDEQTSIGNHVGLRGIAAVLPPHSRDLRELDCSRLLVSDRSALEELGFEMVHVCDGAHDVGWLALESARLAITRAEVKPAEIDVLIWASALSETHVKEARSAPLTPMEKLLSGFNYRASWLQEELHLDNARALGVAQQGCAGMFNALSMAHALLLSDPSLTNILCVGVDALPEAAPREILYNLISDAGCAVVLSRGESGLPTIRIFRSYQSLYGDHGGTPVGMQEVLAFTQIFERRVHKRFTSELHQSDLPEPTRKAFDIMVADESDHLEWVLDWLRTQEGSEALLQKYQSIDLAVYRAVLPYESRLWEMAGLGEELQS